ncbi:DUF6538 domain-containing protein [Methylomonas sp. HYX-M1]|uniref:DUF6538 domain-containing protein n=1 Tax=Methylomonas sp. HYX-M1 TaxID=3139307 RepID=UPI00345B93DF
MSHLYKRGDVYYYRRRIPSASKRFCVSLKTSNHADASRLASCYDYYFSQIIINRMKFDFKNINFDNISKLEVTIGADGSRTLKTTPEEINATNGDKFSMLLAAFGSGLSVIHSPSQIPSVLPDSSVPAAVPVPVFDDSLPTIDEAIELYRKHRISKKESMAKFDTHFKRLSEICGSMRINQVTYKHAFEIVEKLKQMPWNMRPYFHLSMDDIIDQYDGDKCYTYSNVNNYIDRYNSFFNKFLASVFPDSNIRVSPFSTLRLDEELTPPRMDKVPFEHQDLKVIFRSNRFSMKDFSHNYQYWGPLIALYTGARRAEIAQIMKKDVYMVDDYWCIDINDDDLGKKLKNIGSRRIVPIHQELIDLGFLDFVKSVNGNPDTRIFREIKKSTDKEGFGRPLEEFNRYIRTLAKFEKKYFHSFRGTFSSDLHAEGVDYITRYRLSGRAEQSRTVEEKHYIKLKMKTLHENLHKVSYWQFVQHLKP